MTLIHPKRNPWPLAALLLALVALLAACGPLPAPTGGLSPVATATPGSGSQVSPLAGSQWLLDSLRGSPVLPGTQITLQFEQDRLGGFAGCNSYGGSPTEGVYVATPGGEFRAGPVARTLMACLEPEGVMEQEDAYLAALDQATSYSLEGDRLELQDAAGQTVLIFVRRPALTMNPAALAGTAWQLVDLNGQSLLEGSQITLAFHDGGQASGHAGCRDYLLGYEADPGGLHFFWTTMLGQGCLDASGAATPGSEPLLVQEGTYTTALSWADRFDLAGDRLELLSQRGDSLVFEPLPAAQQALEGTAWQLLSFLEPNPVEVEGVPGPMRLSRDVLPDSQVTATFAGGTVSGSAGCNSYGGDYALTGSGLTVQPLFRTEMFCMDPEGVMEQEDRFLGWLQEASQAHVYGTQLWLETADGRALVFYVPG